jgi:uncharacterized protein DUF4157
MTVPSAGLPSVGAGAPLPPHQLADVQARFGHDFSHVRVHGGGEASRFAGRFGADAVTTGSHVFVSPQVSLAGGSGRDVLHHELTHVLQQTGPRPLGRSYDASPIAGAPGHGLRIDPAREAAADHVASSLRHGAARTPVDAGAGGVRGLQPIFGDVWLQRVFDLMTSETDITAGAAHVDATGAGTGTGGPLTPEARQQIANIWSEFSTIIRNRTAEYNAPWGHTTIRDRIRQYIVDHEPGTPDHATALQNAIEDLARNSLRVRTTATGAAVTSTGGTTTTEPILDLDIDAFEAELARYILGRTGILIQVQFARPHPAPPGALRVHRVIVVTVHLPSISSNAWLFRQALDPDPPAMGVVRRLQTSHPDWTRERILRWTQSYLEGAAAPAGSAEILEAWYHGQLRSVLPGRDAAHPGFVDADRQGTDAALQDYMDNPVPPSTTVAQHREHVAEAIEGAMKSTYARLRDFMQPRLRTALFTIERGQYYRGLAEQGGHATDARYVITTAQVLRVHGEALRANATVLETANHWG